MSKAPLHCRSFKFEADFVDSLRCIPMAVRRKLDLCGRKVKLQQWLSMPETERIEIFAWADSKEELRKLEQHLKPNSSEITIEPNQSWQNCEKIPKNLLISCQQIGENPPSLEQWRGLDELERFALVKLSHPGHEHRNLAAALREFLAR